MSKKLKTRKSLLRRFKITKTGKVLRGSSFGRHLRRKKRKSQIRRFKTPKILKGPAAKKVKKLLGK